LAGPRFKRRALLLPVAVIVFAVDRLTKVWVQQHLVLHQSEPVLGGAVYLTHTQNTGMAFSLGASLGGLFLVIALLAVAGILISYPRLPAGETWMPVAMGLVLGGAVGNAYDRVVSGSVTDFIDLRFWPVFNLADSCIVVGALILIWRLSAKPDKG